MSIQHGLILHPEFDSVFWLLASDIIPPLLGHQTPIRLDHHQGWNSTDPIMLFQGVREIRVELHSQPVPMRLLHVGEHLLWGLVTGDIYDLHIVHSLIECLELGSEGLARGAPGGREVEQDQILNEIDGDPIRVRYC